MSTSQTETITAQEAAKRLKKHVGYVYRLLEKGRIADASKNKNLWEITVQTGEPPTISKLTRGRPRRKMHPYSLVAPVATPDKKKRPRR